MRPTIVLDVETWGPRVARPGCSGILLTACGQAKEASKTAVESTRTGNLVIHVMNANRSGRHPPDQPGASVPAVPTAEHLVRRGLPLATILVAGGLLGALWLAQVAAGKGGAGGADGKDPKVAAAMARAACTYRAVAPYPPQPGKIYHADSPTLRTKVKWSTFPPSAGGHYAFWAVWGFYRKAVNPRKVVHNLEHGGVVIWWGPRVPDATVDRLEAFYREQPDGMFGTPIAGLGSKIALTAWAADPKRAYRNGYYGFGHVAVCPRFDPAAFAAFRQALRGVGPERIPIEFNKPGMGPSR
jgi:hypothetical protein